MGHKPHFGFKLPLNSKKIKQKRPDFKGRSSYFLSLA